MFMKILRVISNPLSYIYDMKLTDKLVRLCLRKRYLVIIFSLLITIFLLLVVYLNNLSELVKK